MFPINFFFIKIRENYTIIIRLASVSIERNKKSFEIVTGILLL